MVNILTELQENNKKLLQENQQLRIIARDSRATIFGKKIENENHVLKIAELNNYKEQIKGLKRKTVELLSIWHKEETREEKNNWDSWREKGQWDFWHEEELKRLISRTEEELNEVIFEVIKKLEEDVKDRTESLEASGEWKKYQVEDIKEKNRKLKSASEKISYLEARLESLEEESSQKSKRIEKLSKQLSDSESQNESLHYLNSKPLPALPVEEESKSSSTKWSMFKQ